MEKRTRNDPQAEKKTEGASAAPHTTPDARRTTRLAKRRKWPWVLGGVLLLIILIVLLLPVVLSSQGFTQWLEGTISRSTGGEARIGSLSVGWLRGVRASGFHFRGENGWAQVEIDRIRTQPSFSSLLRGTLALDRTVIEVPQIAIDLRERPAPAKDRPPMDLDNLSRLNDVIVRNASIQVTDLNGQTLQVAELNSQVSMRRAGRTSRFAVDAVVAQANQPGRVRASGQVTPNQKMGWSLRGTSGDVIVEVNDLNLNSLAPLLGLAGVQVQAQGEVSGNITGQLQDGRLENVNADIVGQNLAVGGQALGGDRLQTSRLNVRAALTQSQETINIGQLNVQTDWADITATGRVPMTVGSLTELLESDAAYDLRGQFDINLAALLSQMPNTIGVREGMEITGGRATGTVDTTTQTGRATIMAKAEIAALAGTVDGEQIALSQPVLASLRLSRNKQGAELENLDISAPFATINAGGDFEQIDYQGQIDLAALQSELGPFVNLGTYQIAGQVASKGKVSIEEGVIGTSGTLSAKQLVLASPDGNSVSEPATDVNFSLALDREQQVLTIDTLTAATGFGTIDVAKATVPLAPDAPAPMNLQVAARQVNLSQLKPYLVFFASFPQELQIGGTAQSQMAVTRQNGVYRISTDATRIQNFALATPEEEPFQQEQVTAFFDVYVDPNQKTINVESLQIESPQIRIRKGQFRQVSRGDTARLQGALEGEWDWAAVARVASAFVPGNLDMAGRRQVAINFASTYPADDPNGLLANLNSEASLGFDRAEYMGMNFGPTEINVQIENGLMQIRPFSTTVNNGRLNFAAQADLRRQPILLTTTAPLRLMQGIQITQGMTDTLLKYVNPIFANAVNVSGIINFETETLAIPLTAGHANRAKLAGTFGIPELRLQASLLNQILAVIKESSRDKVLVIAPTKIALNNGVVRYDDMQVVVGDNPVNFGGAIGLNGTLDMTVILPYTYEGRTVRVGDPEAQRGKRIAVPLTGALASPQLDLQRLLELQLKGRFEEQLRRGFERLFD